MNINLHKSHKSKIKYPIFLDFFDTEDTANILYDSYITSAYPVSVEKQFSFYGYIYQFILSMLLQIKIIIFHVTGITFEVIRQKPFEFQ